MEEEYICSFCCGENNKPTRPLAFISYLDGNNAKQEGQACSKCVDIIWFDDHSHVLTYEVPRHE